MNREQFQWLIHQKGIELYRDMPWRRDTRPYYILVSELMLQQTQVSRVIPKFEQFIATFPDEKALAGSSLADVLVLWQGLGYNRRAKYLWEAARMIVDEYAGQFPQTTYELLKLPGVGRNTAGALLAYVYNQPSIFIETNIRTVYIHHFFAEQDTIGDSEITTRLTETLDQSNPRRFYWALMDYGAHLKSQGVKTNARSKHYKKQSKLEGSVRQVRGQILRALNQYGQLSDVTLRGSIAAGERYLRARNGLVRDGIVSVEKGMITIAKADTIDKK